MKMLAIYWNGHEVGKYNHLYVLDPSLSLGKCCTCTLCFSIRLFRTLMYPPHFTPTLTKHEGTHSLNNTIMNIIQGIINATNDTNLLINHNNNRLYDICTIILASYNMYIIICCCSIVHILLTYGCAKQARKNILHFSMYLLYFV